MNLPSGVVITSFGWKQHSPGAIEPPGLPMVMSTLPAGLNLKTWCPLVAPAAGPGCGAGPRAAPAPAAPAAGAAPPAGAAPAAGAAPRAGRGALSWPSVTQ